LLLGGVGLALALTVFLDIAILVVPVYDMQLYDRVLQSQNMDTLAMLSVACVTGLLLYGALDYLRGACFVAIGESVGRHLNGVVMRESVRRAASGEPRGGPELVRDLNVLQGFLASGAVAVPLDALCAPMFLAVLFMLHPMFGFLGVVGISLLTLTGIAADAVVRPALLTAQERRTQAEQALARNLSDPELTDGLGMLPAIIQVWAEHYGKAQAQMNSASVVSSCLGGFSRVVRIGLQAAGMTLGALLVLPGATTPGALMGANLLLNKTPAPFDHLVSSWRHWVLAYAAWCRIGQMLAEDTAAAPVAPMADPGPGLLVQSVSVRTASGLVLLNAIDLAIAPGTLVAVTGPNGAGKTTLLRLLAGLMQPTEGHVLLRGQPVFEGLGTGFVPQSVSLLTGSVAENIGQFRDEPLDRAIAAARRAEVHDIIGRMPRGYDTLLSGNGAPLSGGMRQRVALARALHGSPDLLVLDEPDANLDAQGSDALLRALQARRDEGAIVIVTSHRTMLQQAADRVVTLRDGMLTDPKTVESPAPVVATRPHLATA
jgi:ATP-binding cassette subfamily C protein